MHVDGILNDTLKRLESKKKHFQALRDKLDQAGIPWHDNSDFLFDRTQGEWNGHFFSAIHGYGSYGSEKGYLEVRIDETEPIGWLTAKEAFDLIAGKVDYEQADQIAKKNCSKEWELFQSKKGVM